MTAHYDLLDPYCPSVTPPTEEEKKRLHKCVALFKNGQLCRKGLVTDVKGEGWLFVTWFPVGERSPGKDAWRIPKEAIQETHEAYELQFFDNYKDIDALDPLYVVHRGAGGLVALCGKMHGVNGFDPAILSYRNNEVTCIDCLAILKGKKQEE